MARKTFIAGNWKMNKTAAETKALAEALKESLAKFGDTVTMAVCPTFTSLATAVEVLKGSNVKVGAQNIHWADNGAFTGEISGAMLKEIGVEYVIIGHSERRQYFGETDETVNKRIKAALKYELKPIVCIKDGALTSMGKARGMKQGQQLLMKEMAAAGVDFSKPYLMGYSGLSDELLQNFLKTSASIWEDGVENVRTVPLCSVVGTHAGPGAVVAAFFKKH